MEYLIHSRLLTFIIVTFFVRLKEVVVRAKTFFATSFEIQFHSHIHVTMCIHFMLVSTVEYKKAELNNQMENTKEDVVEETKYLNDNSK